jgi:drug/metabolite transporter (DMT)-like permease
VTDWKRRAIGIRRIHADRTSSVRPTVSAAITVTSSGAAAERAGGRPWLVVAAVCCTVVMWSSAYTAIRAGLRAYAPAQLAALRFLGASLLFGALAGIRGVRSPAARDWPRTILSGVLGFAIYALLVNQGETRVSAGMASFVIGTVPVFTAVLASMTLRERMPWLGWIGLGVSMSGTALLAFGTTGRFVFEPAVLVLLAAAAVQAVYFILQKPLVSRHGAISTTSWAVWSGTACLLPFVPSTFHDALHAPLMATFSILYLAAFPTVVGYATWAFAVSRVPVGRITASLYFIPPMATLIGWLVLGERPTLIGLGGSALAIAGVAVVNLRTR